MANALLSIAMAAFALHLHGLSANGIGPAVIAIAGGAWGLYMEWLRHRSWVKTRDTGFSPPTQHLALAGVAGSALCLIAAGIWLYLAWHPATR